MRKSRPERPFRIESLEVVGIFSAESKAMPTNSLFAKGHVMKLYEHVKGTLVEQINKIPDNDIPIIDAEDLAQQMADGAKLNCPRFTGEIEYEKPPFVANSEVVVVKVRVGFVGSAEVFEYSDSYYPSIEQRIDIEPTCLVIHMRMSRGNSLTLEPQIKAILSRIQPTLDGIARVVPHLQNTMKGQLFGRIQERKNDLGNYNKIVEDLAKSGFKLRLRDDAIIRQVVPVNLKPSVIKWKKDGKGEQEPEISMDDYEEILSRICSMISVCERGPETFSKMGEEDLRTILLFGLNGIFEGDTTGETFNGLGKTDILIRRNDKNLFMAECLIWDGSEKFRKKVIDQLFKYATWRDQKLAVIVFNRKQGFSNTVTKMNAEVEKLPNRVGPMPYAGETGSRHLMRCADDPQKEFVLTCMAFEVPA